MDNLEKGFVCKPWCEETEPEKPHDCAMNVRLYDNRHYVADVADAPLDPELAEQRALFATYMPPETDLINLFVLDVGEDGDPVDMAVELWSVAAGKDEPSAVLSLGLQGLKDLHQTVGQAIALLEE